MRSPLRAMSKTAAIAAIVIIAVVAGLAYYALQSGKPTATPAASPTASPTQTASPSPAQTTAQSPSPTGTQAAKPTTTQAAATKPKKKIRVLVLFDVGGRGDLSFNDMAVLGAERAKKELGVEVEHATPSSVDAMKRLLESETRSGKYDLIIGIGFLWLKPMTEVAPKHPEQKYALIDAAPAKPIKNLEAFVFHEQEVAALVGILAADMATHIGCKYAGAVAGMDIPPLWRFHIGYLYGIKYYDEKTGHNIGLKWVYTGTFTDPQKGKQAAEQLIAQDARVLYGLAGLTHVGMFEAVKEANQRGIKALAIGQDASQEWYDPYHIILSGLKRVDVAVYDAIKSVVEGKFKGGNYVLGLKDGALGISDPKIIKYFAELAYEQGKLPKGLTPDKVVEIVMQKRKKYIDQEAWKLVEQLKQDIISGKVVFKNPATHQEYEEIIKQLEQGNLDAALAKKG